MSAPDPEELGTTGRAEAVAEAMAAESGYDIGIIYTMYSESQLAALWEELA